MNRSTARQPTFEWTSSQKTHEEVADAILESIENFMTRMYTHEI